MRAIAISVLVLIIFIIMWGFLLLDALSPVGVLDKTAGWVMVGCGLFALCWYVHLIDDKV
jgi:hypothetical protein